MTLGRKYRQWVAGLLLIAYTFIAVPVSLWHNHQGPAKATTQLSTKAEGFKAIAKGGENNSSHDCKICSHKYSVYTDNSIQPEQAVVILFSHFNSSYTSYLIETPCFNLSNKSPPIQA